MKAMPPQQVAQSTPGRSTARAQAKQRGGSRGVEPEAGQMPQSADQAVQSPHGRHV